MIRSQLNAYFLVSTLLVIFLNPTMTFAPTMNVTPSNIPIIRWDQTYGGMENDDANTVIQTLDGGFTLIGSTKSSGSLTYDMFVVKTDNSSTPQWNFTYGGDAICTGKSVIQTVDEGFALGASIFSPENNWQILLMKIDKNGLVQWNRSYGRLAEILSLIQTPVEGGFLLAGSNSYDFWLIKTDADGEVEWDQTYGGTNRYFGTAFTPTTDRGYAFAGVSSHPTTGMPMNWWFMKTNSGGTVEWSQTYSEGEIFYIYSLIQTSDGEFALTGQTDSYGAGGDDVLLVKTNEIGLIQWNQTYGGSGSDCAYSLLQTSDEGFLLAGQTSSFGAGSTDIWLLRTDANGTLQWNQTYGGTAADSVSSLIQIENRDFALAGNTHSFGAGSSDMWLLVLTNPTEKDTLPIFPIGLFLFLICLIIVLQHRRSKKK